MSYKLVMKFAATIMAIFGVDLIQDAAYCIWSYSVETIPSIMDKDAHGMSAFVGYTFVLLLGVVMLGLSILTWFVRKAANYELQRALTLGFFILSSSAFITTLIQQITFWHAQWGELYMTLFLLLSLLFGYCRFIALRVYKPQSNDNSSF
jgi:hypothetical protein